MDVEEVRARYWNLVVPACEWRAIGVADPVAMAEEVFARLDARADQTLKSLYAAIDKVVFASYRRNLSNTSLLDKLRGSGTYIAPPPRRTPSTDFLAALSNLRQRDKDLVQLRFWDDLDDAEVGEVLGLSLEDVRAQLARAGTRYLAKLSRSHPDLALTDVEDTIRSIRPGVHRRFGEGSQH